LNNLLFVCSKNQWRSPTAEKVFRSKGFDTRSAGTSSKARKIISGTDIVWADKIFVMEKKHKNIIKSKYGDVIQNRPIIVLDIADEYQYMSSELVEFLEDVISCHL